MYWCCDFYFMEEAENPFFQNGTDFLQWLLSLSLVSFEGLLVDTIGVAVCLCCLLVFLSLYRFSWSMLCRFRDIDGISFLFINVSCLRHVQTLIPLKLLDVGCQHEQDLVLNFSIHKDISVFSDPSKQSKHLSPLYQRYFWYL